MAATYKTVDEYLDQFDGKTREILDNVRRVIQENAPGAKEKISYGMPAFTLGKTLIYFAAMKNHLGIYPMPEVILAFTDRLTEYKKIEGRDSVPVEQTDTL